MTTSVGRTISNDTCKHTSRRSPSPANTAERCLIEGTYASLAHPNHSHVSRTTQSPCRTNSEGHLRDSLTRHQRGHEDKTATEDHRTIFTRISRACTNCSKSKVRCDGASPCTYCSTRHLKCARNKRRISRKSPPPRPTPAGSSVHAASATSESHVPQGAAEPTIHVTSTLSTPVSLGQNVESDYPNPPADEESRDGLAGDHFASGVQQHDQDFAELALSTESMSTDIPFMAPHEWDFQFNITDWMSWEASDFPPNAEPSFLPPPQDYGGLNPASRGTGSVHHAGAVDPSTGMGSASKPSATRAGVHSPAYLQNTANEVLNSHTACSVDHEGDAVSSDQGVGADFLGPRSTFVSFPELQPADLEILHAENYGHTALLSASAYKAVKKGVGEVCALQRISEGIKISLFPPQQAFDSFIQLYFECFERLFPLFHRPSFDPSKSHWIELLALATVGCRYSKSAAARYCTQALSEMLRLSIFHTVRSGAP